MVKLRTLGECVIEVGENRIAPDSKVVFALLLFLGLERGKRFTRSALMEMFWPDSPLAKAAHSLRQTIYRCRKLGAPIEATKTDLLMCADEVALDLESLHSKSASKSHSNLREFLPGYEPEISEVFRDWIERQRSTAHAILRKHLLTSLTGFKAQCAWEGVAEAAQDLLRLDPFNEEATLALAEATAMRGSKVQALTILDRFAKEVGTERQLLLPTAVLRRRINEIFEDRSGEGNPFVGRTDSLEFLASNLRNARQGEGRCVLVWGNPGIGKSRLVAEFEKLSKLQGIQVARVECQAIEAARPFSAFTEIIPQLLKMRGALGCAPRSVRLLNLLINHPERDSEDRGVFGEDVAHHIRQAIVDLLDAVCAEQTLMVVVEDVHWLDSTSWGVISGLTKWSACRRFQLVLTSRTPNPSRDQGGIEETLRRFPLGPLDLVDSRALFRLLAPEIPTMTERDYDLFISVAEGNPYFVRELARHYVSTGATSTLPASLGTLLSDRLRRISPEALRLLQVCALLGRDSTLERLECVLQLEAFELLRALEEVELLELVIVDGVRVTTKHALLSEQALQFCTPATKKLLHRRIAQALELSVRTTHSAALAWTCAVHWRDAGELDAAVGIARECAGHLISLGLAEDAADVLRQAVELALDSRQRYLTLLDLGAAYRFAHEYEAEATVLTEAFVLQHQTAPSTEQHDEAEVYLLEACWRSAASNSKGNESGGFLAQAVRCAKALNASRKHRLQSTRVGLVIADHELALKEMWDLAESNMELMEDPSLPLLDRLIPLTIFHTTCGDVDKAVETALEITNIHREAGRVSSLINWLRNSSFPLRLAGKLSEAQAAIGEAIDIARTGRGTRYLSHLLDTRCHLYLGMDCVTWAKEAADEAYGLVPHDRLGEFHSILRALAYIALTEGEEEDCERHLRSMEPGFQGLTCLARDEAIALQLLFSIRRGQVVDPDRLAVLEQSHAHARSAGRRDIAVAGLVAGLHGIGRAPEALGVWNEYVGTYRRERYALPSHVRRLIPSELTAK